MAHNLLDNIYKYFLFIFFIYKYMKHSKNRMCNIPVWMLERDR